MPTIATATPVRSHHFAEYIVYFLFLLFIIPIKIEKKHYGDEAQFQKYLETFNRSYDNEAIYQQRLYAFKNSLAAIDQLNINQVNKNADYGLTKFSDIHPDVFLHTTLLPNLPTMLNILPVYYTLNVDQNINTIRQAARKYNIPEKVDWRQKNAVTNVQSQDSCSACWAFSSIGMLESLNAIKTGKPTKLSIQQIIDCSTYNNGCKGGDICSLLKWLKENNATIVKEEEYPLTLKTGECKNVSAKGVQIKDYDCLNFVGSEEEMLDLIANNGPVSVAVNAVSWQYYVGGVIQFHCETDPLKLNHAVEIVGYDLTNEVPYYIARNSWGEDFGDNGYVYLAIGKNTCGLAYEVAVVMV